MIIRDPVHGDIELTPAETRVLDHPAMQRLRRIKQLGTAYLVYPGCMHTRFDHSLGTLCAAERILQSLAKSGHRVGAEDAALVRAAALVHDVTHIPFGHTFEDERKVFPRHDSKARMRKFLVEGPLGTLLDELGGAEAVFELITRPSDWRGQIVSGTLDADLLDYLRRDSYFAGLSQDYDERLYTYFAVEGDQLAVDLTKKGLERHDARSEIIHLLRMRYFLTERVYFHHAKVIAGAMVSKALELATELGVVESDLYDLGDESLFDFLTLKGREAGGELGAAIERLVEGVRRRRLLKRAYIATYDGVSAAERDRLVARYHASAANRRELEAALAGEAGVGPYDVILYVPARTTLKEASVLARLPGGVRRLNETEGRHLELAALEEQYERIWRLGVFAWAEDAARVGAAAECLLGYPNELA